MSGRLNQRFSRNFGYQIHHFKHEFIDCAGSKIYQNDVSRYGCNLCGDLIITKIFVG
jgi:hypothetical protein